jgi:hypothetical protein
MAKAQVDAKKAKEKKQKILLIVLGVVFLAVAAVMVPSTLKKLNQKPPPLPGNVLPPNGNPTPAPGQVPLAAPTLGASATPAAAGAAGSPASSSSGAPAPASGQLVSFGRFASKDPFLQQISDRQLAGAAPKATAGKTATSAGGSTSSAAGAAAGSSPVATSSGSGATVTEAKGPPPPPPASASISVNGVAEIVRVGHDFPVAAPLFHLVALGQTWAKIAIVGGSYTSGTPTVTVRKGKPLVLQNTADGTTYEVRLLALNPTTPPGTAPPVSTSSSANSAGSPSPVSVASGADATP